MKKVLADTFPTILSLGKYGNIEKLISRYRSGIGISENEFPDPGLRSEYLKKNNDLVSEYLINTF